MGLLASPVGSNCTAANGCGAHVHSGSSCTNVSTQGGHYFDANATDPWSSVGYTFTTHRGRTLFKFAVETAAQAVAQKPFIIHNDAGARVACGLLGSAFSNRLPKHAVQLLEMKQLPSVEEVEDEERGHEDELDDLDGGSGENDSGQGTLTSGNNRGRHGKKQK